MDDACAPCVVYLLISSDGSAGRADGRSARRARAGSPPAARRRARRGAKAPLLLKVYTLALCNGSGPEGVQLPTPAAVARAAPDPAATGTCKAGGLRTRSLRSSAAPGSCGRRAPPRQVHDDGIHHAPLLPAGDAPREPTLLRHYAAGPRPRLALLGHDSTFVPTLLNARVHNKQLWATDH